MVQTYLSACENGQVYSCYLHGFCTKWPGDTRFVRTGGGPVTWRGDTRTLGGFGAEVGEAVDSSYMSCALSKERIAMEMDTSGRGVRVG